ncbi:DNA-invertase hin [Bacillus rhizoplanae]|uniref:DNA-invertase hin n=1 Tax=Bacillus rhizoplanae TaxID=2880966 RepID=A0ABN8A021_9BACI|nr:recombinase family protein [Bacillus rhizoplanae]CAG9612406.1 DNA-invertase hin [Bacillus rhizoplanae]
MNKTFGYARVSTDKQELTRQLDELERYGVDKIFTDVKTGKTAEREGLAALLDQLREGDTLVITELTRLGRSMKDLVNIAEDLNEMGVVLVSLKENIDMNTATGRAMFGMLAVMAQLEREWISERTKSGLQSARARGKNGGRPKTDEKKLEAAYDLYKTEKYTVAEILERSPGVGRTALYDYIRKQKAEEGAR